MWSLVRVAGRNLLSWGFPGEGFVAAQSRGNDPYGWVQMDGLLFRSQFLFLVVLVVVRGVGEDALGAAL